MDDSGPCPMTTMPTMADMTTKTALSDLPIGPTAGVGSTHTSPLLRLTPLLRRRIYNYIGLVWEASDDPYSSGVDLLLTRPRFKAVATGKFHGLLLSCRDLHTEVAALLYSANRFFIYYWRPGSLGPLRALTPPALASLTRLKIVLNPASCHQPYDLSRKGAYCCLHGCPDNQEGGVRRCEKDHRALHKPPLLSDDDNGLARLRVQSVLDEWHSTAAYISAHITSRLELSLVCDIDPRNGHALDVARSVTAPFYELFPPLKNCHIRLAKTADPRLLEVARDAVTQARGIATPYSKPPSTSTAASLMNLPRELRLHILEYTDLILPWREVTWSRQDLGYVAFCFENRVSMLSWVNITWLLVDCWRIRSDYKPSVGCFCHRYHSSWSSSCQCWVPPSSLFLVCRDLYQDALFVFFTGNQFFVHDLRADPPWWVPGLYEEVYVHDALLLEPNPRYDYPNERFAASQFLRDVVPTGALAHLRFLELVFPAYLAPSWPQAGQPAMQDWWATVDWLRDKINAPGLTLRLVGAEAHANWVRAGYGATITPAEGDSIMQSYIDIVRPLRKLVEGPDGLARVRVDFRYPWQYTQTTKRRRKDESYSEWLDQRNRETNDKLERYVMGDRYERRCENSQGGLEVAPWERRFYG